MVLVIGPVQPALDTLLHPDEALLLEELDHLRFLRRGVVGSPYEVVQVGGGLLGPNGDLAENACGESKPLPFISHEDGRVAIAGERQ